MAQYLLPLHIIFVVTWFAGLFYIVRLFIYHTEAEKKPEPEKSILQAQYKIMERRLWYGITWPSAILTYIFGFSLLYTKYGIDIPAWLLIKLCFVFGLTLYQLQNQVLFSKLQKNKITWTSGQLRMWNELATIFLVAIVFIVTMQNQLSWIWGVIGILLFGFMMWGAIMIYKKAREKNSPTPPSSKGEGDSNNHNNNNK
jgi:putative membrane protein